MTLRKNRQNCLGITNHSQMALIANKSVPFFRTYEKLAFKSPAFNKTLNADKIQSKYQNPKNSLTTDNTLDKHLKLNGKQQQIRNYRSQFPETSHMMISRRVDNQLNAKDTKKTEVKIDAGNIKQNEKLSLILNKIRKIYKKNLNLTKIIRQWGFEDKGFITNSKFHEVIRKNFDPTITKQNCENLFQQVSGRKVNLDVLSFIKIIFDQDHFLRPDIDVLATLNPNGHEIISNTLTKKIADLNEGTLIHSLSQKCSNANLSQLLSTRKTENENKMTKFLLPTKSEDLSTVEKAKFSFYQTIYSKSNPKYNFSTTKSHCIDFTPKMFQGQNQLKTRFGATPPIILNDQSRAENKRQKIFDEKQKVMAQIQNQIIAQKVKYQNKLEKIRAFRLKEKQNVEIIDKRFQERQQANAKKIRQENIAYNYMSFLHNWK